MAIQGLRNNDDWAADQRPKNWRAMIAHLEPNGTAPLTALTTRMSKRKVDDPEFYWWEKEMQSRRVQLSASFSSSATTLTVAAGAFGFKLGDVFMVEETEEIVIVLSDPSSDTSLSVQRGFASSTATALDPTAAGKNPYMRCIGNANEEGSLSPTSVAFDPSKVYNYTQIFRNTLSMTRTASKTRLRTGSQVAEARRECLQLHANDIEMALWFGKKSETTYQGNPRRTMDGVYRYIHADNIVTADNSTGTDMETLEGWMERMFRYGSSEKMLFTGNIGLLTINQIIRKNSTYNIQNGLKEYGMNVSRLICPFGELVIKTHPLFNQMVGGTTAGTAYYGMNSWAFCLDMAELKYVIFQGDDSKYEKDLQANDLDGMKSGYIAEVSMEMHHSKSHFLIKDLATPKVDA